MKYETIKKLKEVSQIPAVSIIVPAFNVENYIYQCVDSIANQTLKNIEIIVIDDCSNDKTLEILINLYNKYPNLSIYKTNKPSGSPAVGRNIGLQKARGNYILFVDSDDWIDSDYIELLYNSIVEKNADICFASGFKNYLDGKQTQRYYKENYLNSNNELKGFHESFMLWDKLFRRNFLIDNNLTISELQASEELKFIIQAYYLSNSSVVSKGNYGYNYRRLNDNSITKSKRMIVYPTFEFTGWQLVDKWANENNVTNDYKNIISLRKVLSFNYAISIINPIHKDRFIKEVSEYIPISIKESITLIAKKLGYEETINNFFYLLQEYKKINNKPNNKGIIFGPDWSKTNLYQALLAKAIKDKYGVYSTGFTPKQLNKEYLKNKQQYCNVLHLHWLHPFYNTNDESSIKEFINNVKFAKELNYTVIITIHNIFPHDIKEEELIKHQFVQQSIYELADYLLVHSQATKESLINKFNVDKNKICITYHGLYPVNKKVTIQEKNEAKIALGYSRNDFIISCIGRIRAYKGIDIAISQFIKYSETEEVDKKSKLIIAGYPDDKNIDNLIIQSVKKYNNISYFRKNLSNEELENILLASDICLLPYIKGTTSGVAYLCLSHKVPMITTNLECFKEFSDNGFSLQIKPENIHIGLQYLSEIFQFNGLNKFFSQFDDKNLACYHWDNIVNTPPYNQLF